MSRSEGFNKQWGVRSRDEPEQIWATGASLDTCLERCLALVSGGLCELETCQVELG